ncbi:MAG: PKD domain-containing protein, partial [Candidatus Thermoplasmatota archaeon]
SSIDQLWWFKGTNVIAHKGTTGRPVMGDVADDSHGTGTSSAVLMANPDAIILFLKGTDAAQEARAFSHPSVDIITTSYGPLGSIPLMGEMGYEGVVNEGKLHFGASDNSPSPAIQDSTAGGWWNIGIAGYDDDAHGKQVVSGNFADFVADFTQDLPYCIDCESGFETFVQGTSFATPRSAGTASKVLLEARRASGHMGGIVTSVTPPQMVVGDGPGITNWQIRRALEEGALYESTAQYSPVDGIFNVLDVPNNDAAPYSTLEWGILAPGDAVQRALDYLANGTTTKSADACAYMLAIHDARVAYWGNVAGHDDDSRYIRCDSPPTSTGFAPLRFSRDAELVDGDDATPAPPPYDIVSVDISDDATELSATFRMTFVVGDQETAAPDANAAWWDFAFKTDTEYILEASGDAMYGAGGTGYTATLWTYDPTGGTGGTGAWGQTADSGAYFTMDWVANEFTLHVPLANVDLADGGVVTNTWASTWPNTFATYATPYDLVPEGANHASAGGTAFGPDYTVGGGGIITPPAEEVVVKITGPTSSEASATLAAAMHTWTYDPAGTLAPGSYSAQATYKQNGANVGGPVTVAFTVPSGPGDTTPPAITGVSATPSGNSATITWTTNEPANSRVNYGTSTSYGSTESTTAFVTSHSIALNGLAYATTYHYQVVSADASGNPAQTTDGTFTTIAAPTESVRLLIGVSEIGRTSVDTSAGDASWSIPLATTTLPNGPATFTVEYTDALGAKATDSVGVTVNNGPNVAPVLATIGPKAGAEMQALTFNVTASDNNGDSLTYTATGLPEGAVFDHSHRFTWLPGYTAAGTYTVTFIVSDGTLSDSEPVTITIVNTNRAPVVTMPDTSNADELQAKSLTASATDADVGDALTYMWTQPGGQNVVLTGAASATVTYSAPDVDGSRTYRLDFTANDGTTSTTGSVDISIRDIDHFALNALPGPLVRTVDVTGTASLKQGGAANTPPVAIITNVVATGLRVTASGAFSTDAEGSIAAYAWELGNSATRTGAALDYTYPAAGTYTITLRVTDSAGAIDDAIATVTVVESTPPTFAVDAGDSSSVVAGGTFTVGALAYNAPGTVTYSWSFNGGTSVPGQAVQFTAPSTPGFYTAKATATAGGESPTDTVLIEVYALDVQRVVSKSEAVLFGVSDEDAGAGGAVDSASYTYEFALPQGATLLDAKLDWTKHPVNTKDTPVGGGGVNDFDLYAYSPGGSQDAYSGFDYPERILITSPIEGAWSATVNSYLVADDTFTLTVDVTTAPASLVPTAGDATQGCFETATQALAGTLSPDSTGSWDLDMDGAFDDGTGPSATTSYAPGSGAHLARFRATSAGLRDTVTIAFRVETECALAPSVVVIGIVDTGINPYSREFAGELMPYPELTAFTTADPSHLDTGDVAIYHKTTGALLPFTKHPSSYIPGFPTDAQAIELTLGGGYYRSEDNAAWGTGHSKIALNQWYWIPGTKIIAAIDTGDLDAGDTATITDEHGHGTASASVAAGNFVGTCKRCVLVFAEDFNGNPDVFGDQPWVDFVSFSAGTLANYGRPMIDEPNFAKAAAERGQTINVAAGNGAANMFI